MSIFTTKKEVAMILGYVRRTASAGDDGGTDYGGTSAAADSGNLSGARRQENGLRQEGGYYSTVSVTSPPQNKQLPLPFDEQLCILRFPNHGPESASLPSSIGRGDPGGEAERRRSGLWRRGKVLYVDFGSGGECA
jgi:hypothetical protein